MPFLSLILNYLTRCGVLKEDCSSSWEYGRRGCDCECEVNGLDGGRDGKD
jgi:hypothetical protein